MQGRRAWGQTIHHSVCPLSTTPTLLLEIGEFYALLFGSRRAQYAGSDGDHAPAAWVALNPNFKNMGGWVILAE